MAVSLAGPPHNALERMRCNRPGLIYRSGAAHGCLSSDLQPTNKIMLSATNFKFYLDGIVPYVLFCSLLYTAQCTLLRVSHQMLMAIVHLFSTLYSTVWYQCTSLYAFSCLWAFGLILRFCYCTVLL